MNKRRMIEAGKSLLIAALTCSALWLTAQSPLFVHLPGVSGEERPGQTQLEGQSGQSSGVAMPMSMAVMNRGGLCGVQYTDQQLQLLFSQVAPVLGEALSVAEAPEPVDRDRWQSALMTAPGVFLDFQTGIPLSVLTDWLSEGVNPRLTDSARFLVLSGGEGSVRLYYRSQRDGGYYVCRVSSVNADYLQTIAGQVQPNGAIFAYQSDHYRMVAPDTLISAQTPQPREFAVANPLNGGEERLEELLERLSFPVGLTTVYDTTEGRRARSGNDTLTISDTGTVVYDGQGERYPVAQGADPLISRVEAAKELVCGVLEPWCGQARIYLSRLDELGPDRWRICFGYGLDNVPVHAGESGYAAQVLVEQGQIRELELQLRSYSPLDGTTLLLPPRQAAAILEGTDRLGSRLELCYQETGDTAIAGWIAGE